MNAILVSSSRYFERDALSEAYYITREKLGVQSQPGRCHIPGLSLLHIPKDLDILEVMNKLLIFCKEEGGVMQCLKFTPLQKITKSEMENIVSGILKLAKDKLNEKAWKIEVKKRQTYLSSKEIISKVAESINRGTVSLTNPDLILRIEILGRRTGLCVHSPEHVISVQKVAFSSGI